MIIDSEKILLSVGRYWKSICYHGSPQLKIIIEMGLQMAKTNYTFEKRQKEIAKKKKQEEKRQRKIAPQGGQPQNDQPPSPAEELTSV
jgi:hypothetical protein